MSTRFTRVSTALVALAVLAACGSANQTTSPKPAATDKKGADTGKSSQGDSSKTGGSGKTTDTPNGTGTSTTTSTVTGNSQSGSKTGTTGSQGGSGREFNAPTSTGGPGGSTGGPIVQVKQLPEAVLRGLAQPCAGGGCHNNAYTTSHYDLQSKRADLLERFSPNSARPMPRGNQAAWRASADGQAVLNYLNNNANFQ